jgi:hypothetical protein
MFNQVLRIGTVFYEKSLLLAILHFSTLPSLPPLAEPSLGTTDNNPKGPMSTLLACIESVIDNFTSFSDGAVGP